MRRPRGHTELHAGDGDGAGALPIRGGGPLPLLALQNLLLPRFLGGAKNAAAATFHDEGVRRGIKAHAASMTILPLPLLPITPLVVGVGAPVGLLVRVLLRAF